MIQREIGYVRRPRFAGALYPEVDAAVNFGTKALIDVQRDDGHFVFELEADATITAEYILFSYQIGEPPLPEVEAKIGNYLRRKQADHGGGHCTTVARSM